MTTYERDLAEIPEASHTLSPSIIVGQNDSGDLEILRTSSNKLKVDQSSVGIGWTVEGDSVTADYSGELTDIYNLRSGGASGTILQTITINYVTDAKLAITSIVKT